MIIRRGVISIKRLLVFLLAVYGLFLPFEEIIVLPSGSLLGVLGIMIMALCLIMKMTYTVDRFFLFLFVWLLYSAASYFWAPSFAAWKYYFMIYAGQTAFLFLVSQQELDRKDLCFVKKGLITGTLIAALIIILFPVQANFTSDGRRTILIAGMKMDPNILSAVIIVGFYSCLDLFFHHELKKKTVLIGICAILAVGVVLTGSRGGVISLTLSALYMLLFFPEENRNQRRKHLIWIAGAALVLAAAYRALPNNALLHRFNIGSLFGQEEYRNGAHNRYFIWKSALALFLQRPMFGYGCGGFFQVIATVYRRAAAHNMLVLELVELGLVGTLPLGLALVGLIRNVRSSVNYADRGLLLAVLLISMTLDTLVYKYFWITLLFVLLSCRAAETEEAEN